MGTSTNAMLCYGYNLGGGDADWKVTEVDDNGCLAVDWYDEDDEEGVDLIGDAEKQLLASVGFTETDYKVAGYHDRKKAAQAQVGVEVDSYCSGDYPMYVLAAKVVVVRRGDCELLDLAALQAQVVDGNWDSKLTAACHALGITPTQERPGWVLVSYWG